MESPAPKLRVMVDANVLVAGIGWPRWPYAILQHALAGDFRLVLSLYVIEEARHHIMRLAPAAIPQFEAFLELSNDEAVETPAIEASHHDLVRDVKDLPVAVAAIQARVDCLVSSDRDLTESDELKKRVNVVLPALFLRDYLHWTSQQLEVIRYRSWSDLE